MKIDLGCGTRKHPGFIGIDRLNLQGVDIVCDLDDKIPLDDNSVDFVLASHSLEHLNDLVHTMEEIYRVCKHKAIVCIVAPYYSTSLNMANPYHKQAFNEHTPRFFTNSRTTVIPYEDYEFPHARTWGLGESDNSKLSIDFRCVRMEFFYFPEYRRLPEAEKRKLRSTQVNVVDQIMYHLLVVKNDMPDEEIKAISKNWGFEEPYLVTIRRLNERLEDQKIAYEDRIKVYEDQKVVYEDRIKAYEGQTKALGEENSRINKDFASFREAKAQELEQKINEKEETEEKLNRVIGELSASKQEIKEQAALLQEKENTIGILKQELDGAEARLGQAVLAEEEQTALLQEKEYTISKLKEELEDEHSRLGQAVLAEKEQTALLQEKEYTIARLKEELENEHSRQGQAVLAEELEKASKEFRAELEEINQSLEQALYEKEELGREVEEKESILLIEKGKLEEIDLRLKQAVNDKKDLEKRKRELEAIKQIHVNRIESLKDQLLKLDREKTNAIDKLIQENEKIRDSKLFKIEKRIRYITGKEAADKSSLINGTGREIVDWSILQSDRELDGFVIGTSHRLRNNDIVFYEVTSEKNNWKQLEVIFNCLNRINDARAIAMEILSMDGEILRSKFINPGRIKNNSVTRIDFAPIGNSFNKRYYVRFVGLEDALKCGISVYEWQRFGLLGRKKARLLLGRLIYG